MLAQKSGHLGRIFAALVELRSEASEVGARSFEVDLPGKLGIVGEDRDNIAPDLGESPVYDDTLFRPPSV